jgi:hypothetical protein
VSINNFGGAEKGQKSLKLRGMRHEASLFTRSPPVVIKTERDLSMKERRGMANSEEVQREHRKIRYLRFLVDFSILSIQQGDLSLEDALKVVEDVKRVACAFFPGKEETFELIYRPRFKRVIQEKFGTTALIS